MNTRLVVDTVFTLIVAGDREVIQGRQGGSDGGGEYIAHLSKSHFHIYSHISSTFYKSKSKL